MYNNQQKLLLSASLICLLGGCAAGRHASLDIRSIDHPQIAQSDAKATDRGKDLLALGQSADAISAFRAVLREQPDSAEAHNGLAIAYDRIGRKDLARRYFELAVAEKPEEAKYRGNLARFFETNGQPELAAGLVAEPTVLAHEVAPVGIASAETITTIPTTDGEPAAIATAANAEDPVAAILADLSAHPMPDRPEVTSPSNGGHQKLETSVAIFRPSASAAIKAVPISLPILPLPAPAPFEDDWELVADLPRNDRRYTETSRPYIERTSLGEVRLVTLPLAAPKVVAFDLDQLGQKLSIWAEDEARKAQFEKAEGLRGRQAIQLALKRAAIDEALAAATSLATVVEQIDRDFVYVRFADDEHWNAAA